MSTNFHMTHYDNRCKYRTLPEADLFDGRLARWGVSEHITGDTVPGKERCLTDGEGAYLWVHIDGDEVRGFTRWSDGCQNGMVHDILVAIVEAFRVGIVSEHEPEYWGFATQTEWDSAWDKWEAENQRAERKFRRAVLRYAVGGKPHGLTEPNDIAQAEIARSIAELNPELRESGRAAELLALMHDYGRHKEAALRDDRVTGSPLLDDDPF